MATKKKDSPKPPPPGFGAAWEPAQEKPAENPITTPETSETEEKTDG